MVSSVSEKDALLARRALPTSSGKYVLVIHGGAGTMDKRKSTPDQRAKYKAALSAALEAGYEVLANGGEAMDAVVAAVSSMEDCPLFNAGRGAVFNTDGKNELEASLMLSKPPSTHPEVPPTRRGFGLTLLTRARNPSKLVRSIYLSPAQAPHTFMSGANAENIGESLGEILVDPSYFFTEQRWREHRRGLGLPEEPLPYPGHHEPKELPLDQLPQGTIGAVALDVRGCIAACTSTGGKTNKLVGRIGDTPHMGAGFWAEEWKTTSWIRKTWDRVRRKDTTKGLGISGTGDGDYFIRLATASTIARRMKLLNEPLAKAAKVAVEDLRTDGGVGGVIALDREGNVAMPMNCSGMYRGVVREDGITKTAIFEDEELS
ncbi:asparaginase [Gloeophyllum trabeum ATCC 11539]|uniref:Asparaginase n=1 Tax=Gloeophyllum trabeum (strain ATCC 11539 / FP-39264 / Madison 617) TaxID=670483 RepID=S7RW89_GLOTA|nr:asparaginase [Gloeophyllum trabeum ATCC 11539]EPQ57564.1 asparaginase [Gloeophyllum trabeum ATCC 11539]